MAGVYANFANVSHSDYEFTITFARVDHEVDEEEIPGVVVSRINLSPRFMRELIDAAGQGGHPQPAGVRRARERTCQRARRAGHDDQLARPRVGHAVADAGD